MPEGINAGTVYAALQLNTNNFEQGLQKASSQLNSSADQMANRMEKLKGVMNGVSNALLTVGTVGAGGMTAMVKMANEAIESENLFTTALGNNAQAVKAWSEGLRADLGLNSIEVRKNAATFYTMFDSMKMGEKASLDMSKQLTQLAYDMSSFYNLDPSAAFEKLRAGIVGSTEPLMALGINTMEQTIKTYAYSEGIAKQGAVLTEHQKVLARLAAIMDQTSKAQGDLARTADSPANLIRAIGNEAKQTAIEFGKLLVPLEKDVLTALKTLTGQLDDLTSAQKRQVVILSSWGIGLSLVVAVVIKGTVAVTEFAAALRVATAASAIAAASNITSAQTTAGFVKELKDAGMQIGLLPGRYKKVDESVTNTSNNMKKSSLGWGVWGIAAAAAIAIASFAWSEYDKQQNKVLDDLKDSVGVTEKEISSNQKKAESITRMTDEYNKLNEKTKLSKEEHEKLGNINKQLSVLLVGSKGALDAQTGAFNGNTKAAIEYAKALEESRKANIRLAMVQADISVQEGYKSVKDAVGFFSKRNRIAFEASGVMGPAFENLLSIVGSGPGSYTEEQKLASIKRFRKSMDVEKTWLTDGDRKKLDLAQAQLESAIASRKELQALLKSGYIPGQTGTGGGSSDTTPPSTGSKAKPELTYEQRYDKDLAALSAEKELYTKLDPSLKTDYDKKYLDLLDSYIKEGIGLEMGFNDPRLKSKIDEYKKFYQPEKGKDSFSKRFDDELNKLTKENEAVPSDDFQKQLLELANTFLREGALNKDVQKADLDKVFKLRDDAKDAIKTAEEAKKDRQDAIDEADALFNTLADTISTFEELEEKRKTFSDRLEKAKADIATKAETMFDFNSADEYLKLTKDFIEEGFKLGISREDPRMTSLFVDYSERTKAAKAKKEFDAANEKAAKEYKDLQEKKDTFESRYLADEEILNKEKKLFPNKDYASEYTSTYTSYLKEGSKLGFTADDPVMKSLLDKLAGSAGEEEAAKVRKELDDKIKEFNEKDKTFLARLAKKAEEIDRLSEIFTSEDFTDQYVQLYKEFLTEGAQLGFKLDDERIINLMEKYAFAKIKFDDTKTAEENKKKDEEYLKKKEEDDKVAKQEGLARRQESSMDISKQLLELTRGGDERDMANSLLANIASQGFSGAMTSWIDKSTAKNGAAPAIKNLFIGKDGKPNKYVTGAAALYTAYNTAESGGALSGGLAGAEAGMTIGGPWGAAIGALAGAIFGGSQESKRAEERAKAIAEAQLEELRRLNNAITPVSDYFRSAGLNSLPNTLTFGGGIAGQMADSYAIQSSRGVRR